LETNTVLSLTPNTMEVSLRETDDRYPLSGCLTLTLQSLVYIQKQLLPRKEQDLLSPQKCHWTP